MGSHLIAELCFGSFPFKGEGWDGGEIVSVRPHVCVALTPTPALPLSGGGSNTTQPTALLKSKVNG
jgi:hypothetical protein